MVSNARGRAKVVIAEDHTMVRCGIEKIIERDYDVVAIVADGRELVNAVVVLKPAVAIVDIGLPGMNGIEAALEIAKETIATRIVFLSMHTEPDYVLAALQAGAHAFIPKQAPPEELPALRDVLRGRVYVSPMVSDCVMARLRKKRGGGNT